MLIIVLPAYNEYHSLLTLIPEIRSEFPDALVILVNDGSTDQTKSLPWESYGLNVLELFHSKNLGLGMALKTGLETAGSLARPDDVIVTLDADCSHSPKDIHRLLSTLSNGPEVVIASRYRKGSRIVGLSTSRRVLSILGSWTFRTLFPTPVVTDYTCGFRAVRASTLKSVLLTKNFFTEPGFACTVDILLKLLRHGATFSEIPFTLHYDRKVSASKLKIFTTTKATFKVIFLNLWSQLQESWTRENNVLE